MELTAIQSEHLFLSEVYPSTSCSVTRHQAIQVLTQFLETGTISWQAAGVPVSTVDDEDYLQ